MLREILHHYLGCYNMRNINKKAQSIIEYALLLVVVSAAVAAMYTYLGRVVQARLKQVESQVNEPVVVVPSIIFP